MEQSKIIDTLETYQPTLAILEAGRGHIFSACHAAQHQPHVRDCGSLLSTYLAHWMSSGTKKILHEFRCVRTPFDIDFLRCKKHAENNN